jgi:hypothetical protein
MCDVLDVSKALSMSARVQKRPTSPYLNTILSFFLSFSFHETSETMWKHLIIVQVIIV